MALEGMHARLCPDVRSLELDLWGPRWWGEGVLGGAGRDPLTQVQPLHHSTCMWWFVSVALCCVTLSHSQSHGRRPPPHASPRSSHVFPLRVVMVHPLRLVGRKREREPGLGCCDGFVSPHFFRPTLKAPFPSPSTQTGIPPTCLQLYNMHYLKVYLWLRCAPCCLQAAAR